MSRPGFLNFSPIFQLAKRHTIQRAKQSAAKLKYVTQRKTNVVVVGAGLAGLTAARQLRLAGVQVRVLGASSHLGGRVHSVTQDGFTLDAGFQVLFTAYPAVRRNLDLKRLDLIALPPAAVICRGRKRETVGRDPGSLSGTLQAQSLSWPDRARVLTLAATLKSAPVAHLLMGEDETTRDFLRRYGFSERFVERFFAPFFGGIFLRRDLGTSARLFRYYFRMLLDGQIALSRGGIGRVTQQLAEGLDVSLNTKVTGLEPRADGVTVELEGGQLEATHVIVATDPPELERLTGVRAPTGGVGSAYLYYASSVRLDDEPRLLLNAAEGYVNNALWLSNVNPLLAPPGEHLLSVTALGAEALGDAELDAAVKREMSAWYGDAVKQLRLLKIIRIPFAQFAQPAGFSAALPDNETPLPNVLIASEATSMSSIQGAMESGEQAAALILGQGVRARGA